jgi:hypothetical protein
MKFFKRIDGVYLKADTINGVYEIDASDITESDDVTTPRLFLECLPDLGDDETQIAAFDGNSEKIYDEIESTYGIH